MDLDNITKLKYFDDHKLICLIYNDKVKLRGYIAIHRGNTKHPAFGATRIWNYQSSDEAIIDALKLSKTMSYKAALAGLHCGGAKAVIIAKDGLQISNRNDFLKSYTEKVNFLGGHFVTGADVGIDRKDVIYMRRYSPYFVGVKADPVRFTGLGLLYSIQACVKEVFGSEKLNGRSFAIQGVGKVGSELLKLIYKYSDKIYISDINESTLKSVKEKYPKVRVVSVQEIYKQKVDVFSPCALGNCLNKENTNKLRCSIIVGGANCQLENEEIGLNLHKSGILYAPDYVVNAGGLISVYDEYENGNYRIKRVHRRLGRIVKSMKTILAESAKLKTPPYVCADGIAKNILKSIG